MIEGYALAFDEDSEKSDFQQRRPESVRVAMPRSMRRSWKHLAKERIEDSTPTIPMGKRFWPLRGDEKTEIRKLFEREDVRRLVLAMIRP